MTKTFLKAIISFTFILLAVTGVFAYVVDIKADTLEYDQKNDRISAAGNVKLIWEGREVTADNIEFMVGAKQLYAFGNVQLLEKDNKVFADSIIYDFSADTGTISNSIVNSSIIFVRAKEMRRLDKDTYEIRNVVISNCDLDDPHSCFKARSGRLTVGKRITVYNAVFYIGKIPVFYLPIFSSPLDMRNGYSYKNFKYTFAPGYTNKGGFSLKNIFQYTFSQAAVLSGYLDYLGKRGWGYGGDFSLNLEDLNANLYAYNMHDNILGSDRFTIRPSYRQRISDKWTINAQGEFVSEDNPNNIYYEHAGQMNSFASVTRQDRNTNLMVAAQRFDTFNPGFGYETTSMSLPQVTFNYFPKQIFAGLTHSLNVQYGNNYTMLNMLTGDSIYRQTASANYSLTRNFKFGRSLTLNPTIGIAETWQDKDPNGANIGSVFNTRYTASLNSRYRATSWMDWNINYAAGLRSKSNSLAIDTQAPDYGFDNNNLSFTNFMYIGGRITVRNIVAYNLMQRRDNIDVPKWSPLTTEFIYMPKFNVTAYVKQTQQLDPFKFQSMQVDLQFGEIERQYFNFGAFYDNSRPDEMDNTIGFGIWVTPKWRFDYTARTTSKLNFSSIRLREHEFKIYRDLHCYNLGVTWRIREGYSEVFFKFDLKTNVPFDRANLDKPDVGDDPVFYPWK